MSLNGFTQQHILDLYIQNTLNIDSNGDNTLWTIIEADNGDLEFKYNEIIVFTLDTINGFVVETSLIKDTDNTTSITTEATAETLIFTTNSVDRGRFESGGNMRVVNSLMVGADLTPTIDLAIGDADTGLNQSTDNELSLMTAGTERMLIESGGDIRVQNNLMIGADLTPTISLAIGDVNTGINHSATDTLQIRTNNSTRMTIDNNSVGIGGAPIANTRLAIQSNNSSGFNTLVIDEASTFGTPSIQFINSSNDEAKIRLQPTTAVLTILSNEIDGEIAFQTNSVERLRITEDGNIGIDTSNPSITLALGDDDTGLDEVSSGIFRIMNNGSETMRFQSDGQLRVGRTSQISTDAHIFQAVADNVCMEVYRPTTSTAGDVFKLYSDVGGVETDVAIIEANGDFLSATGSYGTISDGRLKENVINANSQWEDIKSIQFRKYNFINQPNITHIGTIAQELEIVCPELVNTAPIEEDSFQTKSVKNSIMYMKGMIALQEAQERIETLENQNSLLMGMLSDLSDRVGVLEQ